MTILPLWVAASLGKHVVLKRQFVGPCETYPAGAVGTLAGIMIDERNPGRLYTVVALDPSDDSYLENFGFDDIEPINHKMQMSVNFEEGLIAF